MFVIVDLVFGTKILKDCSSPYKLFQKLSLIFIGVSMSEQCFVEHKGICCLMFL